MTDIPDRLHTPAEDTIPAARIRAGRWLARGALALLLAAFAVQALHDAGTGIPGFATWRPVLYAYVLWSAALCASQVLVHGDRGKRTLFVLPAVLFVVAMVVFPLLFGLWIAFSDWNLSGATGRRFNGVANLVQMWHDPFYWNALATWCGTCWRSSPSTRSPSASRCSCTPRFARRKFWRVAFLMPLMLSPVAVAWMVGKSMLEPRFGPVARFAR